MTREEALREINEAIDAGQYALTAINEAESNLNSARNFGIWDMLGGGLISGLIKHSKLDKAEECMQRAQDALRRFQREIQDVDMNINYGIKFDGMTKAIDLLCDNLIVDAIIQSKIKEAQANLQNTKYQVQQAIEKLYSMKNSI